MTNKLDISNWWGVAAQDSYEGDTFIRRNNEALPTKQTAKKYAKLLGGKQRYIYQLSNPNILEEV